MDSQGDESDDDVLPTVQPALRGGQAPAGFTQPANTASPIFANPFINLR